MKALSLIQTSKLPSNFSERIVGDLLKISPEEFFLGKNSLTLSPAQINKFKLIEKKILAGEPPQYATGEADFYGQKFKVNKNVLIPRPETEILLLRAKEELELRIKDKELRKNEIKVIDVGTGSGCIIVSLAKELEKPRPKTYDLRPIFYASDISDKALGIAQENAKRHHTQIKFFKSDLLKNNKLPKKFDLILANLPYLPENYLENYPVKIAKPLKHEPALALDGGKDGLNLIGKLIADLPRRLEKNGLAIFEIGPSQKKSIDILCKKFDLKAEFTKDLNNFTRFAMVLPR